MTDHTCTNYGYDHPVPAEDPARVVGPEVGAEVTYHTRRSTGLVDLPATVKARSYVWSPGECSASGGTRRYDWTVIVVHAERGDYTVVVDNADLKEA